MSPSNAPFLKILLHSIGSSVTVLPPHGFINSSGHLTLIASDVDGSEPEEGGDAEGDGDQVGADGVSGVAQVRVGIVDVLKH